MGNKRRKRARRLSSIAKEGAIRVGHQGLYGVVDRLRASAAKLDGAKRREVLFKCDQTRQALDAGMQAFAARLRDPSVSDHAAIYEGVYNLLEGCQPLYHAAMSSKGSFAEACDEFDAAQAMLDHCADADEKYKKHRKLNGGWVYDNSTKPGKRVKLDAKAFAAWQAANKRKKENFKQNPYEYTNQTTDEDNAAFRIVQKSAKKRSLRAQRRTKEALNEEEEPTPPELQMWVMGDKTKKYRASRQLMRYAPKGTKNPYTTMEEAMKTAASCLANRPAGTTFEEKQADRGKKGMPQGVYPEKHYWMAKLTPKKNTYVTLAAPDGGYMFASSAAAGKAIEKYEKAGSPTTKKHPLVYGVRRVRSMT